ncbi:Imm50 family immunity protein [Kitasatospora kifunensis]|uniref:Immunity protein 50 of polymorphic toxin system n=1 Tax=Kitasatospora kifunensis TaxID=58351 RepID=A0A7W7VTZ0_KITKI|nr:Imm50 family immunity protein [Kitasatospora kifunensis]MBB4921915.1 hypothetical protein [Kitasatospora kifunensis]
MTPVWADLLRNPEKISALYGDVRGIDRLTLRSVNLDRRGPTVTLRLSTNRLPDHPPVDWVEFGCDTVEFHLQFLDVADLSMTGHGLPEDTSLQVIEQENSRVKVEAHGDSTRLAFSCHRSVTIGRLSAWNSRAADGEPTHRYLSPLDRRLHAAPPETWKKNYYGRI